MPECFLRVQESPGRRQGRGHGCQAQGCRWAGSPGRIEKQAAHWDCSSPHGRASEGEAVEGPRTCTWGPDGKPGTSRPCGPPPACEGAGREGQDPEAPSSAGHSLRRREAGRRGIWERSGLPAGEQGPARPWGQRRPGARTGPAQEPGGDARARHVSEPHVAFPLSS